MDTKDIKEYMEKNGIEKIERTEFGLTRVTIHGQRHPDKPSGATIIRRQV